MIDALFEKLQQLRKSPRLVVLSAGAVVIVMLLVIGGVSMSAKSSDKQPAHQAITLAAANSHAALNKAVADGTAAGSAAGSAAAAKNPNAKNTPSPASAKNAGSPAALPAPTTTVVKTVTNNDGTTTKEIVSNMPIAFATQTQNEVNLKRGTTQVVAGQNGIEVITYSVTYDRSGKEISRKTLSDTVTKQPVAQITKIGTSDFNLNADTWDGTEFGEICLVTDYGTAGDGCLGTPSDRYFSAVSISGTYYVSCIGSDISVCDAYNTVNVLPIVAIRADNTFSYQGATYRADPRKGGGGTELLTAAMCSKYGLACGSW